MDAAKPVFRFLLACARMEHQRSQSFNRLFPEPPSNDQFQLTSIEDLPPLSPKRPKTSAGPKPRRSPQKKKRKANEIEMKKDENDDSVPTPPPVFTPIREAPQTLNAFIKKTQSVLGEEYETKYKVQIDRFLDEMCIFHCSQKNPSSRVIEFWHPQFKKDTVNEVRKLRGGSGKACRRANHITDSIIMALSVCLYTLGVDSSIWKQEEKEK